MSLFRRVLLTLWPKRRDDAPLGGLVVPEVGAQMCVAASCVYVPCGEAEIAMFAACSARTSSYAAVDATKAIWGIASPVGSFTPGIKSAKGTGCA